jgi:hypothetical protein
MRDEPAERRRLGEILVERGLVTEGGLQRALDAQSRSGGLLGQILLERGWLSEEQLQAALAEQEASEQVSFELSHGLRSRLNGDGEDGEEVDSDSIDVYFVQEEPGTAPVGIAGTFLDAADIALEAIDERDPPRLEIVRSRGRELENVWTYERAAAASA